MKENQITQKIIDASIKIHKALGPGLDESVYESCLYSDILESGLYVERQKPVPLIYRNVKLECGFRADLVVEDKVVVEVRSVEALNATHFKEALTYVRLLDLRVGLLLNFNVVRLKQGLKRVVNDYQDFQALF